MPHPRHATTSAPRLDPIRLGPLTAGTPDLLIKKADLEGLSFSDIDTRELVISGGIVQCCQFTGVSAHEADWKSARLVESTFERLNVPVVRAARGVWRDLRFDGARLGSVEAYETSWHAVQFVACKLDFVNLRAAELLDVAFTDCIIDEIDLMETTARRVAFHNTRVARLNLQHAQLEHVDLRGADVEEINGFDGLRGATITPTQLALLAPLFAHEHGITIQEGAN
jgi:uncharacterized protein YjbI with pentapeptide repeats